MSANPNKVRRQAAAFLDDLLKGNIKDDSSLRSELTDLSAVASLLDTAWAISVLTAIWNHSLISGELEELRLPVKIAMLHLGHHDLQGSNRSHAYLVRLLSLASQEAARLQE